MNQNDVYIGTDKGNLLKFDLRNISYEVERIKVSEYELT